MHHNLFTTPRKRFALFSTLTVLTSLVLTGLFLYLSLSGGGYYFHGGVFIAFTALLSLTTAVSFALSLIYRKHAPACHAVFHGHLTATTFHVFFMLVMICSGGYHIGSGVFLIRSALQLSVFSFVNLAPGLCLLMSGLASIGGLRFSFHSMGRNPLPVVLSGVSLSASCIFYALYLYFDLATPKNGSMKQLLILGMLCLAVYYLSEIRRVLGKPTSLLYRFVTAGALQINGAMVLAPVVSLFTGVTMPVGDIFTYFFIILSFCYIFAWTVAPHFWLSGDDTELPIPTQFEETSTDGNTPPPDSHVCDTSDASNAVNPVTSASEDTDTTGDEHI